MSELNFRYGRIWFGDTPEQSAFSPTGFKEMRIDQATFIQGEVCRVCMRLFLPGFADSSGVLGVQFTPIHQNETLIRVGCNQPEATGTTTAGLTETLAEVVVTQAANELRTHNPLGSGLILFDRAIFDPFGSTPFVFRVLTSSLINILATETLQTADDLAALVNAIIKAENKGIREHKLRQPRSHPRR